MWDRHASGPVIASPFAAVANIETDSKIAKGSGTLKVHFSANGWVTRPGMKCSIRHITRQSDFKPSK